MTMCVTGMLHGCCMCAACMLHNSAWWVHVYIDMHCMCIKACIEMCIHMCIAPQHGELVFHDGHETGQSSSAQRLLVRLLNQKVHYSYIFPYICLYHRICVHICNRLYHCICECLTHSYIHAYMSTNICIHIYPYTCLYLPWCTCSYILAHIRTYVYAHVYARVCMHSYTRRFKHKSGLLCRDVEKRLKKKVLLGLSFSPLSNLSGGLNQFSQVGCTTSFYRISAPTPTSSSPWL